MMQQPTTASARSVTSVHPWWLTLSLCGAAALLFGLAYPRPGWWPLIVLSPLLLGLAALGGATTRRVVLMAWLTQWIMWFWLQRWLVEVTPLGWPLLAAYLGLYPTIFCWALRRLTRIGCLGCRVPLVVLTPLLWTGTEYVRAAIFMDGYPWFLLGQPLIEWPVLVQSVDLFGVYGATLMASMVSGAGLEVAAVRLGLARLPWGSVWVRLTTVVVILVANFGYGFARLRQGDSLRPGPTILAVQTNLAQSNKKAWDQAQQVEDLPKFASQTLDALRQLSGAPDLIVWPETMVPGHGFDPQTLDFQEDGGYWPGRVWLDFLQELRVAAGGLPMLVGSPTRLGLGLDEEGTRWTWEFSFNSAYLIDRPEPPFQRYDKTFLTPFGETMPYISSSEWLEEKLLALGASGMSFDLDASDEGRILQLEVSETKVGLATPICFEDTANRVCRDMIWKGGAKQADLIINLSNDGWFGQSDDGRLLHAQLARFRCIENRVPMVRAANTGLSVHIDSCGKLIGVAGEGRNNGIRVADWLLAHTTLDDRVTLFARIGNLLPQLVLVATGLLILTTFRRPRATRGD